jgi:P-aminobenzoate N-oxygenase AurF
MAISSKLDMPELIRRKIVSLTEHSHSNHINLNTSLRWTESVDRNRWPKRPEACWIYGTPAWDALTQAQRLELAWAETARDVSMFIWLEQALPPLYMGYINKQRHLLQDYLKDYLLVFSKEEIVHIQVFRRYMALTDLAGFNSPEGFYELYVEQLPQLPPVIGMLATLLVEWVAESTAVHAIASKTVEPLTRQMFLLHHREELRHISFAKWVISSLIAEMPTAERMGIRAFTEPVIDRVIRQSAVNREIALHVPFDLGFTYDDEAAVEAARCSANNLRINGERYGPVLTWLRQTGLVGPEFKVSCMPQEC